MSTTSTNNPRRYGVYSAAVLAAAGVLAAGCANGKNANPAPAVASANYNVYAGTQSFFAQTFTNGTKPQYGGAWNVTLDKNSGYFSYYDLGLRNGDFRAFWNQTLIGTSTASGGFRSLAVNNLSPDQQSAGVGGYVLEIAGDAAIVRPGKSNVAPVIAAAANGCQTLKDATYNFIALGAPFGTGSAAAPDIPRVAYGSITATTEGTTWKFSKFAMYYLDGTVLDPAPAALPDGGCSIGQAGYTTAIPVGAATNDLPYSVAVSPNGYFVLDQGQGSQTLYVDDRSQPGAQGPLGLVGVEQPTAALDTGKLVAAKYLGFEFAPVQNFFGLAGTPMVSFGQAGAGTGTAMTGGGFVNDDPVQPIDTSVAAISIDLGQQDSATPGLYKAVTVTVPDRFGGCAKQSYGGMDANGLPSCTFSGVAVVGFPNGKYAIFVSVNDLGEQSLGGTPLATLHFFLYQQ